MRQVEVPHGVDILLKNSRGKVQLGVHESDSGFAKGRSEDRRCFEEIHTKWSVWTGTRWGWEDVAARNST